MSYESKLNLFTAKAAYSFLRSSYRTILENINQGVYIWGTGRLGKYVEEQCKKNGVTVKGFVDNDITKQDKNKVYSAEILQSNDVVIIASICYSEIAKQLDELNTGKNHIYYEVLANIDKRFKPYYVGFFDLFEEIEKNKQEYIKVLSMCEDQISYEVLGNVLMYRMTLDTSYIDIAYNLSIQQGKLDFDKIIIDRLNNESVFCDVGGFDGESTEEYLRLFPNAEKIYLFEPDKDVMKRAKEKLCNYKQVNYISAAAGEKDAKGFLNAIGEGASSVATEGDREIEIVALDHYIVNSNTYVKMDVEGYEAQAITGAENAIKTYKPLLGISLYHIPGDMHKLTKQIMSYRQDYRLYIRHYTLSYGDTLGYFI